MESNRRRSLRIRCGLPVVWKRGPKKIEAVIRDVNADGMFIETTATIPLNQMIELVVTLPSGPISVTAVTRLCGPTRHGHGIGVTIFVMEPRERYRWNAHYRDALETAVDRMPASVAALLKLATSRA